MKICGQILWNALPICETFRKPLKGPIIPFGSLFEYHPITAKDQSRIHQFGKKVLLRATAGPGASKHVPNTWWD